MTAVWDPISEIISTSKDIAEIYAALLHALSMIIAIREDIHKLQYMPSKKCNEWIRQVIKTEEEVGQLRSRYDKLNHRSSLFFALQLKSIIKEMKIKGMIVIKLLEAGQFLEESKHLQVFVAPPPSPPESVIKQRATDITKFPNLQASLRDTLKLLEDEGVKGISIVGIVGIGKSSILRNLNNHVQVAKTFDIVLWIKVFSTKTGEEKLSIQQLQKAIGKRLKVDMTGFNNFDSISQAISKELDGKKYLLVLDDFQYDLDIYQTGVPDCNNGSKIVLTTNWRHFCSRIVDQVVRVSYLSDHESWMMLQHLLNRPELDQALVRRIIDECGGHQLLVGAMANILRTKGDVNWWTEGEGFNNLRRLSKKEHHGVEEFYGELYRLIKYCFSGLEEGQRKCFLYAALYPLGSPIYVDSLLECWEAEDFLGGTTGHLVLEHLKNKLLLEEGEDPKFVTMHKCMRQVALYVAYDDPECKYLVGNDWKLPGKSNKQWRDKNWISLGNIKSEMLPGCPDSGKLSTLFLQKNMDLDCIPPTFFKNMKSLNVLDFCHTVIRCLPPSFSYLVSLKVLYLSYCTSLLTLPTDIEKLKCLEVLDIRGSGVKNLPSYIKLKGLRRLRISFFPSEKENEAAGASFDCAVISELHLLEELVIDVESVGEGH